jgi:hypothetical protein
MGFVLRRILKRERRLVYYIAPGVGGWGTKNVLRRGFALANIAVGFSRRMGETALRALAQLLEQISWAKADGNIG